jgi:hypothetical protein
MDEGQYNRQIDFSRVQHTFVAAFNDNDETCYALTGLPDGLMGTAVYEFCCGDVEDYDSSLFYTIRVIYKFTYHDPSIEGADTLWDYDPAKMEKLLCLHKHMDSLISSKTQYQRHEYYPEKMPSKRLKSKINFDHLKITTWGGRFPRESNEYALWMNFTPIPGFDHTNPRVKDEEIPYNNNYLAVFMTVDYPIRRR